MPISYMDYKYKDIGAQHVITENNKNQHKFLILFLEVIQMLCMETDIRILTAKQTNKQKTGYLKLCNRNRLIV